MQKHSIHSVIKDIFDEQQGNSTADSLEGRPAGAGSAAHLGAVESKLVQAKPPATALESKADAAIHQRLYQCFSGDLKQLIAVDEHGNTPLYLAVKLKLLPVLNWLRTKFSARDWVKAVQQGEVLRTALSFEAELPVSELHKKKQKPNILNPATGTVEQRILFHLLDLPNNQHRFETIVEYVPLELIDFAAQQKNFYFFGLCMQTILAYRTGRTESPQLTFIHRICGAIFKTGNLELMQRYLELRGECSAPTGTLLSGSSNNTYAFNSSVSNEYGDPGRLFNQDFRRLDIHQLIRTNLAGAILLTEVNLKAGYSNTDLPYRHWHYWETSHIIAALQSNADIQQIRQFIDILVNEVDKYVRIDESCLITAVLRGKAYYNVFIDVSEGRPDIFNDRLRQEEVGPSGIEWPMQAACHLGDKDVIEDLIRRGTKLVVVDYRQWSSNVQHSPGLIQAVKNNNIDLVHDLLWKCYQEGLAEAQRQNKVDTTSEKRLELLMKESHNYVKLACAFRDEKFSLLKHAEALSMKQAVRTDSVECKGDTKAESKGDAKSDKSVGAGAQTEQVTGSNQSAWKVFTDLFKSADAKASQIPLTIAGAPNRLYHLFNALQLAWALSESDLKALKQSQSLSSTNGAKEAAKPLSEKANALIRALAEVDPREKELVLKLLGEPYRSTLATYIRGLKLPMGQEPSAPSGAQQEPAQNTTSEGAVVELKKAARASTDVGTASVSAGSAAAPAGAIGEEGIASVYDDPSAMQGVGVAAVAGAGTGSAGSAADVVTVYVPDPAGSVRRAAALSSSGGAAMLSRVAPSSAASAQSDKRLLNSKGQTALGESSLPSGSAIFGAGSAAVMQYASVYPRLEGSLGGLSDGLSAGLVSEAVSVYEQVTLSASASVLQSQPEEQEEPGSASSQAVTAASAQQQESKPAASSLATAMATNGMFAVASTTAPATALSSEQQGLRQQLLADQASITTLVQALADPTNSAQQFTAIVTKLTPLLKLQGHFAEKLNASLQAKETEKDKTSQASDNRGVSKSAEPVSAGVVVLNG